MSPILVLKADGSEEPFEVEKLKRSLHKAGATAEEIADITQKIEAELYSGIKTEVIYKRAFKLLRESETLAASKYSLRRALFGLGPTGFPFEDFLSKLFRAEGYHTKTRVEIEGKCAPHELDVVATKEDECFATEAKFHSRPGVKSDLQVALYSYARFLDLEHKKVSKHDPCGINSILIVTNTKFTHTAIKYAECIRGLNLLSWSYPHNNSLQDRIERTGLYPITVLQSLSNTDKRNLLERGNVMCHEIIDNRDILQSAGVSSKKTEAAVRESVGLCTIK